METTFEIIESLDYQDIKLIDNEVIILDEIIECNDTEVFVMVNIIDE